MTGGTGLIGKALIPIFLEKGHSVVNLSRGRAKGKEGDSIRQLKWDGRSVPEEVGSCDIVINLAGAGIADKRWTESRKKLLWDSRVDTTRACADYINAQASPVKLFINASGANFYDSQSKEKADESSPAGKDFLSELCVAWEAEALKAQTRTVLLRTSVVLDLKAGALPSMVRPYKFFVGGPISSGKQGFPWIHLDDYCKIVLFCIENEGISGPVNTCSPLTPSQGAFAKVLAKVLKRPNFFRVPGFMLKLLFGELAIVLLEGVFMEPRVLKEAGFEWQFPGEEAALRDVLGK